MKGLLRLGVLLIAVGVSGPALGFSPYFSPSPGTGRQDRSPAAPHPAVVRVIAPERGGMSLGSGTLVAIEEDHGIVLTNWHVVRDAAGPVQVVFPDGFRSRGVVLKVDRDWDLAAIAIQRPRVEPVTLSEHAPRRGEVLTIAGYGPGPYRAVSGRCVQYWAPSRNLPNEIVELSTPARHGDSGGPIFNSQGELAGVLFGATNNSTSGTYCGRVGVFLESIGVDATHDADEIVASIPAQRPQAPPPRRPLARVDAPRSSMPSAVPTYPPPPRGPGKTVRLPPVEAEGLATVQAADPIPAMPDQSPALADGFTWRDLTGATPFDQAKTALAVLGLLLVLLLGWRAFRTV